MQHFQGLFAKLGEIIIFKGKIYTPGLNCIKSNQVYTESSRIDDLKEGNDEGLDRDEVYEEQEEWNEEDQEENFEEEDEEGEEGEDGEDGDDVGSDLDPEPEPEPEPEPIPETKPAVLPAR